MEQTFIVAEAFRAQSEAFANLFAPKSWIEDFRTKGDSAYARVVSNDDFARRLFRLNLRRRRYADARRVVRFWEYDAAAVDRRACYAGHTEPGRDGERYDADDTDAQLDPLLGRTTANGSRLPVPPEGLAFWRDAQISGRQVQRPALAGYFAGVGGFASR